MVNQSKKPTFTIAERGEMLRITTSRMTNVEIGVYTGLVTEYAEQHNATVLVKGLRAVTDFEYVVNQQETEYPA